MLVPAKYYRYVRRPSTCTRYGESWRPLSMPRGTWGAFFAVREPQRRLQYCRHKCRRLQYCRHKCRYLPYYLCQVSCGALSPQAYRVWSWYRGLTLCAVSPFAPSPFRAGIPGRIALVGTGHASRRRAVSRLATSLRSETRGRSRKQRFGPGLPIGESTRRRPASKASAPVREVGRRSCRAGVRSFDGPPVNDRSVPPARCFLDFLGRPMSYRLFSWAEPGHRSRSPRDPRFMNPTVD